MKARFEELFTVALLLLWIVYVPSATASDRRELMRRTAPKNGPVETAVEDWTILAPGTGGLRAPTCSMCIDQMVLYDDLVSAATPFNESTLSRYYKDGRIGLYGDVTFKKRARAIYPDAAFHQLADEFTTRGYNRPITYKPPNTLVAGIDWDAHHVPHVVGETVEDASFGLGYATVYTNMIEMLLFRYLGRSGLLLTGLDIHSLDLTDLSGLIEQLKGFKPLNFTRDELMDTFDVQLCDDLLGPDCQEMASAMVAYREGINQALMDRHSVFKILEKMGIPWPKWEVIDIAGAGLAVTGVFGDPGADQLANLEKFRSIRKRFGEDAAMSIFADYRMKFAPSDETVNTINAPFANPVYDDGSDETDPDRYVDASSIAWVDPETTVGGVADSALRSGARPHTSNWMVITKDNSATGHPLLVGGPQMGYFRPNILMEFDVRTTDDTFQITGLSLPGLFIAAFAGNGHNGVWTPTSAMGNTSDLFVEKLCSPDGAYPVDPEAKYYWYRDECRPMRLREDNGTPFTVHGPVVAWKTVAGEPVAISRKSYNVEHIAQGIMPYYILAKGGVSTAQDFVDVMQHHILALNYLYINSTEVAYITTGLYPVRAAGAQTDLPTWGTGQWDWRGVIPMERRPHIVNPDTGYLVNWNNQPAPGFYQSNGNFQRVQILDRLVGAAPYPTLPELAQISETAALQDGYAPGMLPLLATYTEGVDLVQEEIADMLTELDRWVTERQAKRLDLDRDDLYDDAGPAIMDAIMVSLKASLEDRLSISLGGMNFPDAMGSAYADSATSRIFLLLNRAIANGDDPVNVAEDRLQCADGTFTGCQTLVIEALVQARNSLMMHFDTATLSSWHKEADKIELLPLNKTKGNPWHWQNRPTFQQVATVQ